MGENYKDKFRKPQELLAFAGLGPTDKVLDVTTGFGYLAKHIAKVTSTPVDAQNGSEWRGFFVSVGVESAITDMAEHNVRHYWSSMENPGLSKTAEYDLITMQNTFHDLFDMPIDRTRSKTTRIVSVTAISTRTSFLRTVPR